MDQIANLSDLGSAHRTYCYLQTYGSGGIEPSELPQFTQIYPFAVSGAVSSQLAWANNFYTLASFRPDGSTALANALRLYLVDLRTVTQPTDWGSGSWAWSDPADAQHWNYLVVEINHVTGRVRTIDPDQP
jgi:hypothetical protein